MIEKKWFGACKGKEMGRGGGCASSLGNKEEEKEKRMELQEELEVVIINAHFQCLMIRELSRSFVFKDNVAHA